jgi:hypothetical protein
MTGFQQVAVLIAATGLVTALVLPGRTTASVVGAGFKGITDWTKVAQGRG